MGLTGQHDWYPPQIISSPTPHFSRVIITGNSWNLQFKKDLGFLKKKENSLMYNGEIMTKKTLISF